jgi:hypothetical protein
VPGVGLAAAGCPLQQFQASPLERGIVVRVLHQQPRSLRAGLPGRLAGGPAEPVDDLAEALGVEPVQAFQALGPIRVVPPCQPRLLIGLSHGHQLASQPAAPEASSHRGGALWRSRMASVCHGSPGDASAG